MATKASREKHNKKHNREVAKKVAEYRSHRQFAESNSLLRQMKLAGRVTSTEVKGKTYFSLA